MSNLDTPVTVVNRALLEAGTRKTIKAFGQVGPEGDCVSAFYDPCRQQLLRAAPWGFARRTVQLVLLGSAFNNPPDSIAPWKFMYQYPPDCLKVRYLFLPYGYPGAIIAPGVPATGYPAFARNRGPNRKHRFLVSTNVDVNGNDTIVILTDAGTPTNNDIPAQLAEVVYTRDVTNPAVWDTLFTEAMVMMLANKFVVPLSGNVKLKSDFVKLAQMAILEARAADANEAIPSANITPDWIKVRGTGARVDSSGFGTWGGEDGGFLGQYDEIDWGA